MPWKQYPKKRTPAFPAPPDTPENRAKLDTDIAIVRQYNRALLECYLAIHRIRTTNLWRLTHLYWKDFCAETFGFGIQYAARLEKAGSTIIELQRDPDLETFVANDVKMGNGSVQLYASPTQINNVDQALAVSQIPKKMRKNVLETASADGKFTAKRIRHVTKTMLAQQAVEPAGLPGHVESALKAGEAIEGHCRTIKVACTGLETILNTPFGVHAPAGQPIDKIREITDLIRLARPYADCVYCSARGGDCGACKAQGWLTQTDFKAAPEAMRKTSRIIAP